jgi:hypothetical protein
MYFSEDAEREIEAPKNEPLGIETNEELKVIS